MATKKRRPMPAKLRAKAKIATARHQRRSIAPDIAVTPTRDGWDYGSPYSTADDPAWCALLFEAFGTRHGAVAHAFINHLAMLCSRKFSEESGRWHPNEDELLTAISLVQSLKPKNEAEAALAAQAVAIHFTAMKVGKSLATTSYPDPRTVASLAALGKAYAAQIETMHKLRGRKTTRQRITVSYEKHVHTHQHVHVEHGGVQQFGDQPHAPKQGGDDESRAAMPGEDQGGRVVLLPSRQGDARLPDARGQKVGSSKG